MQDKRKYIIAIVVVFLLVFVLALILLVYLTPNSKPLTLNNKEVKKEKDAEDKKIEALCQLDDESLLQNVSSLIKNNDPLIDHKYSSDEKDNLFSKVFFSHVCLLKSYVIDEDRSTIENEKVYLDNITDNYKSENKDFDIKFYHDTLTNEYNNNPLANRSMPKTIAVSEYEKICSGEMLLNKLCLDWLTGYQKNNNWLKDTEIKSWCGKLCSRVESYEKDKELYNKEVIKFSNWEKEATILTAQRKYLIAVAYRIGGEEDAKKFCSNLPQNSINDCMLYLRGIVKIDEDRECQKEKAKLRESFCLPIVK